MPHKFTLRSLPVCVALAVAVTGASAQDYPSRPITIMVGLAAAASPTSPRGSMPKRFENHRPARHRGEPHRRGRRRRRSSGAERRAGRPHLAGILRLAARHRAGGQHRDLRAVKGFSPITYLFNSVVVLTVPR